MSDMAKMNDPWAWVRVSKALHEWHEYTGNHLAIHERQYEKLLRNVVQAVASEAEIARRPFCRGWSTGFASGIIAGLGGAFILYTVHSDIRSLESTNDQAHEISSRRESAMNLPSDRMGRPWGSMVGPNRPQWCPGALSGTPTGAPTIDKHDP